MILSSIMFVNGSIPPYSPQAQLQPRPCKKYDLNDYIGEFTLNYDNSFNNSHNFSGVAGYSLQYHKSDVFGVNAKGYQVVHFTEIGSWCQSRDISLTCATEIDLTMVSYINVYNFNYLN